mmetsp:Transcript_4476/g.11251  ORF Transcript_4476/g.11251 Transcript_4476/m.11251 type:complete len:159 (+) Transcript_4476:343-819(+)
MVRKSPEGCLELLEGLSSNVFVIYQDGSLHTASPDLVLPGYVRHLVLQLYGGHINKKSQDADDEHGMEIAPILLQDVAQWREVFITSSSRLILPVRQIVIRATDEDGSHWRSFWSSVSNDNDETARTLRTKLQRQLLEFGGYALANANNATDKLNSLT